LLIRKPPPREFSGVLRVVPVAEAAVNIEAQPQVASQTLDAVAREVASSLSEARVALEAYAEQPGNLDLLKRCGSELAQVQGVLRVMEIHGAALLAEEMHQVARYLEHSAAEQKNQAEALDALMRAMVQLPSYLERVLAGGRDLALVLLPLLNDMRAVRGSPLLSEGTLLLLNLKSDRQAEPRKPDSGDEGVSVAQWARKNRARFQQGLIGWIRGERIDHNLDTLAAVATKLEQVATTQPLFQLWWVVGAVIASLRDRGLDSSVSVKRLLGLADREIKRLYDEGEPRYAQNPPVELLNNLLYYVARSTVAGPRVAAVRASFRLSELLPVDESIEQERENLSAPSVKLMQTVAAAIREDLSKIKDVLDIYVRRGGAAPEELASQVELLRKIGDTLGVLGLGEQRARVQGQIVKLEALVGSRDKPADSVLVDIAAALIRVEDHLDDELVGMILPRKMGSTAVTVDIDFQQVQSAVLRECVVNLARVKEYVTQNVGGTLDAAGFDNWQSLMQGIQAGLLMLGRSRAVTCLERITGHLRHVMQQGGSGLMPQALDRLADSIVSVEYYMETLQAGRADPWYMLDNAESSLAAVESQPARGVPTVAPVGDAAHASTLVIDRPRTETGAGNTASSVNTTFVAGPPVLAPAPTLSAKPILAEAADPELIALFLEEANEELNKIRLHVPQWDQDPAREDSLINARRAFHTLKGSGRVVGARDLAEFSWSIENLINRLIDKTLGRSPVILSVLREAVATLPQLVRQLEDGTAPTDDIAGISARAHALAAGRSAESSMPTAREVVSDTVLQPVLASDAPSQQAPAVMLDSDATLHDIYAREISSHVTAVRTWITRTQDAPPPHVLPEPVYRACHTLSGSSKMAAARQGIRLAEPLNNWLRKSFDTAVGLTPAEVGLLADCMTAMESVSRHLNEDTGFFLQHSVLLERIVRADADIDRRIGAESSPPVADYDPEIASIFGDEATELLEESQSSFQGISLSAPRSEEFAALKRPLHTLKGGARMAGVTAMGDLAHELESLITGIELGTVPPSTDAREAVQASLDELARMRDLLAASKGIGAATALLARVRTLSGHPPTVHVAPVVEPPAPVVPVAPVLQVIVPSVAPEPEVTADEATQPAVPVVKLPLENSAFQAVPAVPERPAAFERLLASAVLPPGREPTVPVERAEMARVDAELLNQLLNHAGEVSIARSRVEQHVGSVEFNLVELSRTVTRLKEQLHKLEIETETQILHRHESEAGPRTDFDPLELDRYSSIQQFSRALAETASDVASIQQLLETLTQETTNLLQQQGRTITELQNGLMRTRMVSFQRHVQRLSRIVRQAASDTGKQAELVVEGASGELDRQVLEKMLPPFEHPKRDRSDWCCAAKALKSSLMSAMTALA
jgi:chemosensory pili system protein ChpA (sensor histidine kinase/response regulator)